MLFGDSLTELSVDAGGLGQKLSSAYGSLDTVYEYTCSRRSSCLVVYKRKMDVLNRGFSGYNTNWAVPIFEQVRLYLVECIAALNPSEQIFATKTEQQHVPKVRLLTIWFGANDAAVPSNQQHVPLETFSANLSTLIHMVTDAESSYYSPETKIILITPPPVNTHQWGAYKASKEPPDQLDRHFETTKTYAEAVKDVAKKEGVQACDIWTAMWKAAGEVEEELKRFMTDGLHLNADGYQVKVI